MLQIRRAILLAAVLILVAAGGAVADTQFICSITETTECSDGVGCGGPAFEGITLPSFIHVDVDRKVITLLAPDERRGEESVVDVVRKTENGWILAGLEIERAWTLYVTDSGNMTLTVTMDGTTWTAFGRCMPAKYAKPQE